MKISDYFVLYLRGRVGYWLRKRIIHIVMYNAGSNPVRSILFLQRIFSQELLRGLCILILFLTNCFFSLSVHLLLLLLSFFFEILFYHIFSLICHFLLLLYHLVT